MQYVLTKEEWEELQKNKEALTADLKKELLCKYAEKVQQFDDSLRKRVRETLNRYGRVSDSYSR
jgi:hypothetical protein